MRVKHASRGVRGAQRANARTVTGFEHPAALSGPAIRWDALERLLVVRPDNLGDVLLAGPAIAALRAAAPRARLELLASPAGAPAAALLPEVDGVIVARVSWQQIETTAEPPDTDLVARLAERHYDAAVVLTSFSQSPWPAGYALQQAAVPVRAGTSKEFGGTALTHWVPAPDDGLHQVDRALHLLARLGVASGAPSAACPRRYGGPGGRPRGADSGAASTPTSPTRSCCRAPRVPHAAGLSTGSARPPRCSPKMGFRSS